MSEDSSRAAWLQQARSHLRQADPVLARLIDDRPEFDPRAWMTQLPPMDLYGDLEQQGTVQVHRRELGNPRPGVEVRPVIDEARQHGISLAQVRARLLQPRDAAGILGH